jgi:hypothetical protein
MYETLQDLQGAEDKQQMLPKSSVISGGTVRLAMHAVTTAEFAAPKMPRLFGSERAQSCCTCVRQLSAVREAPSAKLLWKVPSSGCEGLPLVALQGPGAARTQICVS